MRMAMIWMIIGKKLLEKDWMNCVTEAIERSSLAMMVPVTWVSK